MLADDETGAAISAARPFAPPDTHLEARAGTATLTPRPQRAAWPLIDASREAATTTTPRWRCRPPASGRFDRHTRGALPDNRPAGARMPHDARPRTAARPNREQRRGESRIVPCDRVVPAQHARRRFRRFEQRRSVFEQRRSPARRRAVHPDGEMRPTKASVVEGHGTPRAFTVHPPRVLIICAESPFPRMRTSSALAEAWCANTPVGPIRRRGVAHGLLSRVRY